MWPPIVAFVAFTAVNLWLWTRPIEQAELFLISLPLGAVYFWGVFRLYRGASRQNVPG